MFEDLISVNKPKISVIVPSLNHDKFLVDTIESIHCQSYRNFEIIVIDGGSKDNTVDILKQYPHIKWISEKDENMTEVFRKGLGMSSGEYIIQCCVSDGFLDNDWFKQCVEVLDKDNEISLVWGLPRYMLENGVLRNIAYVHFLENLPPQKTDFLPFWLATEFFFPEGNYCMRRKAFDICLPQDTPDDPFQKHPALGIIYKFNSLGFLPYFLPVIANFGRFHEGQRNKNLKHIEKPLEIKYSKLVKGYRKKLLKGQIKHSFKKASFQTIRTIDLNEIKQIRKKTREYQITRSIFWQVNLAMIHKKIRQYGIGGFFARVWHKLFHKI